MPTKKTRAQVEAIASYGVPQGDIAKLLSVTEPTLRKHYRSELDLAEIKANAMVAQSLFQKAVGGNVSAAQFWLRTRAGWKAQTEPSSSETDYERTQRKQRRQPLGKKEAAAEAAEMAGTGTSWADDLRPSPSALRN